MNGDLVSDVVLAAGLGLIVGLEREHADLGKERTETRLGVRTFALVALTGFAAAYLGEIAAWLGPATFLCTGALLCAQYFRAPAEERGLTTEFAALLVLLVGMLVRVNRLLAVTLTLGATVLLISKPWVRRMVPRLRRAELTATLQLLIALAIVLPLLPKEAHDPWGVLSPRKIGLFVTLVAGVGFVGYVLTRILGPSRGVGLSGLIGGLASSTAVTAAMASQAGRDPTMSGPGQLATFLANAVMSVRVLVVAAVISRDVARPLALPMAAMALCMLLGAAWCWRHGQAKHPERAGPSPAELENPFALVPALKWGLLLSLVLTAAAVARETLGARGVLITAGVTGLADVDAITLAVSHDVAANQLSAATATLAITLAVVSNTIVKATIARVSGGRSFGQPVIMVFACAMAVGVGVALMS